MFAKQFEIYWVSLDPTIGSEINKTRPCLVISPDSMNAFLNTIIVAPITSTDKNYPTRVNFILNGKSSNIVLDQIKTIDKRRLISKIDLLGFGKANEVKSVLQEIFA